jgi:hypothetical protein
MSQSDERDEAFEAFLGRFTPRSPDPMPEPTAASERWWLVASAAVLIVAAALALNLKSHPTTADRRMASPDSRESPRRTITLGRLASVTQWDPKRLDQALFDASPNLLPNVEQPNSTLGALSKP